MLFCAAHRQRTRSIRVRLLIPSIEVVELGLQEFNAGPTRTAIGLGVNLPQNQVRNTYQLQDNISYTNGNHAWKFGVDIRRNQLHQLFKPTTRGLLEYASLDFLVKDFATRANINKDLPGTAAVLHNDWHDFFFYGQDEWKIRPNFTLTLGLRYENAGQPIQDLVDFNQPVLAAFNNDPRFVLRPVPGRDNNNFQPRFGFNWNPQTRSDGVLGWLTGGDKLVLRGGYTRTHDYAYTNIALNIWSSFPFVAAVSSFPTVAGNESRWSNCECHRQCIYSSAKPAIQSRHRESDDRGRRFPHASLRFAQLRSAT